MQCILMHHPALTKFMGTLIISSSVIIFIHGWLCNSLDVTVDCHDRYNYHQHHNCMWTIKNLLNNTTKSSLPLFRLTDKDKNNHDHKDCLRHTTLYVHGDYKSLDPFLLHNNRIPLLNRYTQTNFGRRWEQYFPLDTWLHRDSSLSLLAWDSRNLQGTRCTPLGRFFPGTDQVGTPYRTDHHLISCICLKWDKTW